ncbi:GH3 domain-containing protein-like [Strongylocentrotus purpuratus]|uniref:GH3 C-terminal domain-containing protein n=1 Tax=Strongylocentrotus purpuratus TaxID=7668 RepID=A0A7M7N1F6_STRPU|nr:GH3 domain-containing protein-like [Strongylocentrotus purpuratus]
MNQVVLKAGLQSAVGQWNDVGLVEYAVAESTLIPKSSPAFEETEDMPYYVIFLELHQAGNTGENKETKEPVELASNEIMSSIDAELRGRNSDYERLRREGAISHPRVHILKPGTFEDLKQYVLNTTNTTANQYKVPQRLRTVDTLNFMFDHEV